MRALVLAAFMLFCLPHVALADARTDAQLMTCESSMTNITVSIEMYQTDHKMKLPSSLAELSPAYLKVLPTCMTGGTYKYELIPGGYSLSCTGQHEGLPAGYPRYTTNTGFEIGPGRQTPLDHCRWLIEQSDNLSFTIVSERQKNPAQAKADVAKARHLLEQARQSVPGDISDYMKKSLVDRIDGSEKTLDALYH
jgi:hypothetical protein